MAELLDDDALTASAVVANNAMNRTRRLASYERELALDITAVLARRGPGAPWLDLCCGEGRAGIEAVGLMPGLDVVGVDLVEFFADAQPPPRLRWIVSPLSALDWAALGRFDLVTCVHGLHYVGDALGALAGAASVLADDGLLAANLDVAALRDAAGEPLGRRATAALRRAGFAYDGRKRRVMRTGRGEPVSWPWRYLGADDGPGPNYTGQEAVTGWYGPHNPPAS